jgi:hypothetical protein
MNAIERLGACVDLQVSFRVRSSRLLLHATGLPFAATVNLS